MNDTSLRVLGIDPGLQRTGYACVEVKPGCLDTRLVEARGRFDDGSSRKINRSVVYRSSNPAVARVDDAPGRQGRVTAVSVGTALVTAVDVSSAKASSNPVVVTVVP